MPPKRPLDGGEAIQAMGGMGYINETPPGRLWRDAKLYEIGAGTSRSRWLIGRELLRISITRASERQFHAS